MHGHELLEQLAALVLVTTGTFFLAAAWLARRKVLYRGAAARTPIPAVDRHSAASAARASMAILAFGAAVIHLAVVPEHLAEFAPFGIAFAGLAVVQIGIGVAASVGAAQSIRWPAGAVTFGAIVTWFLSRTVGLPVGPDAWHAEQIGAADIVATAFEVGLLAMVVLGGGRTYLREDGESRRANVGGSLALVPIVGLLGVTALLVAAAAMTDVSDQHHHGAPAVVTDSSGT